MLRSTVRLFGLFGCLVAAAVVSAGDEGAGLKVHSMVTRDGRRLVSRMEGTNEVFSLVAADELPAGTPPARPWRLYAVKATHTDIGLHSSQYVQRHGAVKRIGTDGGSCFMARRLELGLT